MIRKRRKFFSETFSNFNIHFIQKSYSKMYHSHKNKFYMAEIKIKHQPVFHRNRSFFGKIVLLYGIRYGISFE